jgi:vacuolar-type H+-ATPase subunit H
LPKALEMIVVREGEAAKILDAAKAEAQRIRREAEEKVPKIHVGAYEEAIGAAEQEAAELKKSATKRAELETKSILQETEQEIRNLQEKAKSNLGAAVKAVLADILS